MDKTLSSAQARVIVRLSEGDELQKGTQDLRTTTSEILEGKGLIAIGDDDIASLTEEGRRTSFWYRPLVNSPGQSDFHYVCQGISYRVQVYLGKGKLRVTAHGDDDLVAWVSFSEGTLLGGQYSSVPSFFKENLELAWNQYRGLTEG